MGPVENNASRDVPLRCRLGVNGFFDIDAQPASEHATRPATVVLDAVVLKRLIDTAYALELEIAFLTLQPIFATASIEAASEPKLRD